MHESIPNMNSFSADDFSRFILDVPHQKQQYSWDCGLACTCMLLRYLGKNMTNIYTTDLDYLQCGEDVWTIDLAYLMERHGIQHHMCTVTLGIHTGYKTNAYYAHNYDVSAERINRKFEEAPTRGIHVEKRSVSIEDIIDHLKSKFLVIVLLDAMFLECCWCDKFHRSCLCCLHICPKIYQGHFVVLCGYDCDKKHIFYKNPGIHQELCCSSWDQFDVARKRFGTDEDILFIDESSSLHTKLLTEEDIDNLSIS